eukprot:1730330-Pleurochrysis_carterae.AAC.3
MIPHRVCHVHPTHSSLFAVIGRLQVDADTLLHEEAITRQRLPASGFFRRGCRYGGFRRGRRVWVLGLASARGALSAQQQRCGRQRQPDAPQRSGDCPARRLLLRARIRRAHGGLCALRMLALQLRVCAACGYGAGRCGFRRKCPFVSFFTLRASLKAFTFADVTLVHASSFHFCPCAHFVLNLRPLAHRTDGYDDTDLYKRLTTVLNLSYECLAFTLMGHVATRHPHRGLSRVSHIINRRGAGDLFSQWHLAQVREEGGEGGAGVLRRAEAC